MTEGHLNLFCLVDGESTSNAFPLTIPSFETVGELRKLIKVEKTPEFDDIAADKLTLWSVLIPDNDNHPQPIILLDKTSEKVKLRATTKLSKIFQSELPDDTIHIIVQRPPVADPNAGTSFNVRVEDNPPKPRAAPQDRGEPLPSVGPPLSLGSASQASQNRYLHDHFQSSYSALFNAAESQNRSPQSTPQNNGGNVHNPIEAVSDQGSEGPSIDNAHLEGGGGSQNHSEALTLLLQAANKGDIIAQRNLGFIYKHGQEGVAEDYTEAQKWFKKAADQGDFDSMMVLAFMKKNGQGGSKDLGRFLELGGKAIGQRLIKGHRLW